MPVGDRIRQVFQAGVLVEDHVVVAENGVSQTVEQRNGAGTVVRTYPSPIDVQGRSAATLRQRAQAALTANATFLALASPTQAQVRDQVQTLTKECTAVIKLALGLLDDISGT